MTLIERYRAAILPVAATALLVLSGCQDDLIRAIGGYTGPQPDRTPIVDERVIVRSVRPGHQGQISVIVERLRFTEAGDWHNVNRVVDVATTPETQEPVTNMELRAGDVLRISTQHVGVSEASGAFGVPDWPGHRALEYPIGLHLLTAVAREP